MVFIFFPHICITLHLPFLLSNIKLAKFWSRGGTDVYLVSHVMKTDGTLLVALKQPSHIKTVYHISINSNTNKREKINSLFLVELSL